MRYVNQIICGDWVEKLEGIPDNTYHLVITSPPYWRQRDYKAKGQLGREKTPEIHIKKLVKGFREVRRVLRDDGVMFLNYGEKMSDGKRKTNSLKQGGFKTDAHVPLERAGDNCGLEQGNMLMLPARVAIALQADGWILRNDIIWAKGISFCSTYAGSPMPESVNGTRWERHRIKTGKKRKGRRIQDTNHPDNTGLSGGTGDMPEWKTCPGCPKCNPNDGYVLRRGSWRCVRAHEYLFQFVKTNNYFCDAEAVKEAYKYDGRKDTTLKPTEKYSDRNVHSADTSPQWIHSKVTERWPSTGRNLRDVWTINPRGYSEAHYATFPEELVEPCIKVATSEKGVCPKCGAQWARMVHKKPSTMNIRVRDVVKDRIKNTDRVASEREVEDYGEEQVGVTKTLGWKATCNCGKKKTVPAIVLDPFMGSGTVAIVATELKRYYTGIEINPEYVKDHIFRRIKQRKTGISVKVQKQGFKGLLG